MQLEAYRRDHLARRRTRSAPFTARSVYDPRTRDRLSTHVHQTHTVTHSYLHLTSTPSLPPLLALLVKGAPASAHLEQSIQAELVADWAQLTAAGT